MKRTPLPPRKKYPRRSTKPIRQVNPEAKAKRDKRNAKDRRSPHMKEIRKQALERAGNQCEGVRPVLVAAADTLGNPFEPIELWARCIETERLELHHLKYPRVRKLNVDDVQILCRAHHREAEARKLHRWGR